MAEIKALTETSAAIEIGAALADAKAIKTAGGTFGAPYLLAPSGYTVQPLDQLMPTPSRAKGATRLFDATSFGIFVSRNKGKASRLYGRFDPPAFKAVFNDTGSDGPGWGDHTATYDCPLSREWKTWMAANGKPKGQTDFASFIEDNALDIIAPPDVTAPTSAEMLEVALTFEAKKKVNFASGIRLDNGQQQLTYEEQIEGTSRKGQLQVPQTFWIGIPVFEGAPRYFIEARFRYRIGDGGQLAVWYDLIRPHKALEDATKEVWQQIEADTGMTIFNGGF